VLICNDAASALESADSFQPQVALLDIGLPIVDGYALAKQRRERLATPCRFVAITGNGQESDKLRSHEAGFARHLVKPVTPKDVLDCIEGDGDAGRAA
jgi:CheY-like chemotaxis protein